MTEIWTDETGLLVDDVGVIVCDICPCDQSASASVAPCDPTCWNQSTTGPTVCYDESLNEIDCHTVFTYSTSGPPSELCAGDEFTMTLDFTNDLGRDLDTPPDFRIGISLPEAIITVVASSGGTAFGSGTSIVVLQNTNVLLDGNSLSMSLTIRIDSVGSPTPTDVGTVSIGGDQLGQGDEDPNPSFGDNWQFGYGCE